MEINVAARSRKRAGKNFTEFSKEYPPTQISVKYSDYIPQAIKRYYALDAEPVQIYPSLYQSVDGHIQFKVKEAG